MKKVIDIFNSLKKHAKRNYDGITDSAFLSIDIPRPEDIRSFINSSMWRYISDTLKYRINAARDDLEDQNLGIDTIRVHQGRLEELRFLLDLPDFIIDNYDNLRAELDARVAAKENIKNKEV